MIFVTGDTHGDYSRFDTSIFPEQGTLTKADYMIVCGDFGIWDTSKERKNRLDQLEARPFTTLFVDGNHENFDLLDSYPPTQWKGGSVHFIRPSIIHLMRGQTFELNEKRIFTMGGASSHDVSDGILNLDDSEFKRKRDLLERQGKYMYRINHRSWWKEELPSQEEYETARASLEACDWNVDYVFTHCGPSSVTAILGGGLYQPDALTDFLEEVSQRLHFDYWFFGHYHDNRNLMRKYLQLYEQILELPEE